MNTRDSNVDEILQQSYRFESQPIGDSCELVVFFYPFNDEVELSEQLLPFRVVLDCLLAAQIDVVQFLKLSNSRLSITLTRTGIKKYSSNIRVIESNIRVIESNIRVIESNIRVIESNIRVIESKSNMRVI